MRPVVTPAEMAAIDDEAPEPVAELIPRAAGGGAREAADLLGHTLYGKRIAVVAGPGNNGADGRYAVPHLDRRGARCTVFDVGSGAAPDDHIGGHHRFDLVVDAAFGTGLRRDYDANTIEAVAASVEAGTPVLAVDIASGVDGETGQVRGHPHRAARTVTFAAEKPGLLLEPGSGYAGEIVIADIGLDCSRATIGHVEPSDIGAHWPRRTAQAHKWRQAVAVIGGSPGMTGAPALTSAAALRSGAGYVAQSIPGSVGTGIGTDTDAGLSTPPSGPVEAVQRPVPNSWAAPVLADLERFGAVVIGPGLAPNQGEELAHYLDGATTPTVLDAGALTSLAALPNLEQVLRQTAAPVVLTPHDGEFAVLAGEAPGADRIAATRRLAARLGVVVLLKGPTTVVAQPDGQVLLSTAGDARLATAGTGDVLAGVIAAGLAGGLDPLVAAAVGAELHGQASANGRPVGLTAHDLPELIADLLSRR